MSFLENYTLFLFDLDGLLVNTEEHHFLAYKKMLQSRGFTLTWDFPTYFSIAEQDSKFLKERLYQECSGLAQLDWNVCYSEKKEAFIHILQEKGAPLMPGANVLLKALQEKNKKCCVVTHSPRKLVDTICAQNPVLNTIEHWFCREDYTEAKPHPDGYVKAIATLAKDDEACIGFEDSKRGMQALMQTRATPVFVNALNDAARTQFQEMGVHAFKSLDEVLSTQGVLIKKI